MGRELRFTELATCTPNAGHRLEHLKMQVAFLSPTHSFPRALRIVPTDKTKKKKKHYGSPHYT